MLSELPRAARWYIRIVTSAGALALVFFLPRASLTPVIPLLLLVLLSALTSAFKVHFPIASGSSMSVSYVVDIVSLILRGPHATMIVGAVSGWTQTTFNTLTRQPRYRTLFNMACLSLTVEAAGQVYERLGGTPHPALTAGLAIPLAAMALTYFFANTGLIATAVALSTRQNAWTMWKREFASSAPSYLLGAVSAAVVVAVTESSGYGLTLLLTAAPLYLTYKMYRAGVESTARQGAILEAAHDAILTVDQRLTIREFNPAAEQMFGLRRMDILGRSIDLLFPPASRDEQLPILSRYVLTGRGPRRQLDLTGVRSDGAEFPIEVTVARFGSDPRSEMAVFIRDVTERHALEEQLRRSQKLEAIGRLAGGVAHDFNNILMSIMGSADLLMMQLERDDPARAEASEVKHAVQRGAAITRQLLALSRRQTARPRLVVLDEIVAGMETMLRRLIGPEIDFDIVRAPEPVTVVADPAHVEQVVLNLVINARDAMPAGGQLIVRVEEIDLVDDSNLLSHVEGHAGRYARLTVSDTGTGIDEATRARLFEPFFTTKEHGKGTGLGLSIVYGIVRQGGGYVTVASEPGRGATFMVYLPAATAAEPTPV